MVAHEGVRFPDDISCRQGPAARPQNTPMKRAFTLIELLVVIAIIAILAAILFPVFAQAKLAAKKIAGLSQAKQIGTSTQIYLNDSDDTFFPYRVAGTNPAYAKLIASKGQAYADSVFGSSARTTTFFNQLLDPYIKNDDIWKAPTNPTAWVGYDVAGNTDTAAFQSYGGQNSYGANTYLFTPAAPAPSATSIENVSNVIMLVDASYYNVLPINPCVLKGSTFIATSSTYPSYWKNLGNSYIFPKTGGMPSDTKGWNDINARYGGKLNVVRCDTSAKTLDSKKVVNDTPTSTYTGSMWDPYAQGCN